ncbi:MAG: HEAT repeat domain-containing protein, partial [Pirellulaceae bacterium]
LQALLWRFIDEFNTEGFREIDAISDEAMDAIRAYDWPGNVRELRNNVEAAFAMGEGPVLKLSELAPELRGEGAVHAVRARGCTSCLSRVRSAAWWALWKLANDQQAIGQLIQLLADKDWMVNQAAGKYLATIGSPAVIPLTSALKESPQQGQAAAADSLAQIGAAAQPAVLALQSLLAHDHAAVATAASRALGQIGPAALPVLLEELAGNQPQSRLLAIEAIAAMGPQGAAAVTMLIKRLNHPDQQTRHLSVKALGAIGPAARSAVPELVKLLAAADADLRGAACQALGKLGPAASSARQRLQQLANQDPIDFVRQAAQQAARQLDSQE